MKNYKNDKYYLIKCQMLSINLAGVDWANRKGVFRLTGSQHPTESA